VQPDSALVAILVLSAIVPAAFNVAGSLALLRFRLDDPAEPATPSVTAMPQPRAAVPAPGDHSR
jgi:hypothetical protein